MTNDPGSLGGVAGGEDDEPIEVPLPKTDEDEGEEEVAPNELSFCELCGTSEDDDDELLRCEECGRLHCTNCREYDDEGTPYCAECYDEIEGK